MLGLWIVRSALAATAIVPIAAGAAMLCAALYVVGAVGNVAARTVFRAIDYELNDNFRNSPKGGYYDRNGGGYYRPGQ